jgi:hypothetical protein
LLTYFHREAKSLIKAWTEKELKKQTSVIDKKLRVWKYDTNLFFRSHVWREFNLWQRLIR